MQPQKDGARHGAGVGVEMTMSLIGPPGLHRHTTVPTDSLPPYMNMPPQQSQQAELQNKLSPAGNDHKTQGNQRSASTDHRIPGHDPSSGLNRDHRFVCHDVRSPVTEMKSPSAMRGVHDSRGVEILASKEAGRITPDLHNQPPPQQHHHHQGNSRKYPDLRGPMIHHEKSGVASDPGTPRDGVQHGQSLVSSRPGSSSHTSQQPTQLSVQEMTALAITGAYPYELQPQYTSQMTSNSMNSMISPSGVPRKLGSVQLSPSAPPSSLPAPGPYTKQMSGRSANALVPPEIHQIHGHDMSPHSYMSVKQAGMYSDNYNKALAASHYPHEMTKTVPIHDVKRLGQHQMVSQHRDLIREPISELIDPPNSSGYRSSSKSGLETLSYHKIPGDSAHEIATRAAADDQIQKSVTFMNSHPSSFNKGHEAQSSIPKTMGYPPGSENIHRSGQDPFLGSSHDTLSLHSGQHQAYASSHLGSNSGIIYLESEQHAPRVQKSIGVIRQAIHPGEERGWREGYDPSTKQIATPYPSEDMIVHASKSCIPHHTELESGHPPLHAVGAPRTQGSISTGQPRINSSKPVIFSEQILQPSPADRYSTSQKEHMSSRPSSVGRPTQYQQTLCVNHYEERSLHEHAEKPQSGVTVTAGGSALDLTKLNQDSVKPVDIPLDLTVKTKKRRADDRETSEYERMVSAAKRQKLETACHRSSIPGQKSILGMAESAQSPLWLPSSSLRPSGGFEHRAVPSPVYSSHASLTRSHKYGQGIVSDGRSSADSRVTRERLNSETRLGRDGLVSTDNRSALDQHAVGMTSSHGKVAGPSIVQGMVRHPTINNPPMVPLTTQLQKVKEEQAYQMKLQRMSSDPTQGAHSDAKHVNKDTVSPRHIDLVSGNNEVVVVRHPQQHYDIAQQSQQQQSSQHLFMKQQQQQPILDSQQLQQSLHHPKFLTGPQDIIELGMKDSSDPLQASRGPNLNLRGLSNQTTLLQQHHHQKQQQQQQMCIVQQRQFSPKEQQQQLTTYSHPQQTLYSKEQQFQTFPKDQFQFVSQHHYPRVQYSTKHSDEVERFYQKQQLQQRKHETDGYKQKVIPSQNIYPGAQKWNILQQQTSGLKAAYSPAQSASSAHGEYRSSKSAEEYRSIRSSPGYSRPQSQARPSSGRECDGYKYGFVRQDRLKSLDSQKSTLPQIAGPLPAGGVREESRRALSRRDSYSGSAATGTPSTDSSKQPEGLRKKSASSLPERVEVGEKPEPGQMKSNSSTLATGDKIDHTADGTSVKTDDVQVELSLSQTIPSQLAGTNIKPEGQLKDAITNQAPVQFAMPLSVSIPQTPSPVAASTPSPAGSSTSKPASSHKAWSRKHMILNAVNQDETLKRIFCSNVSKHETGGIPSECKSRVVVNSTSSPIPTSPKMPILSPQEDEGEVASEEQEVRVQTNNDDPPNLDSPNVGQTKPAASRSFPASVSAPGVSCPGVGTSSVGAPGVGASSTPTVPSQTCSSENPLPKEIFKLEKNNNTVAAKDRIEETSSGSPIIVRRVLINSLPDQQFQPDDPQKSQPGNGPYQRGEVIRRNPMALPALGTWGHTKNIPVANVAPFVHSRDDDEKSMQQKLGDQLQSIQESLSFPSSDSTFVLSGQTQEVPKEVLTKTDIPKQNGSTENPGADRKIGEQTQDKKVPSISSSPSTKNDVVSRKRKLTKLRVSSPTTMKELELISPTLEYAVLKSSSIEKIKALDKLNQQTARKSLENRLKYKHRIIREKNNLVKQKKVVRKRIQYVFDDEEDEEEDEPAAEEDEEDDEDFEIEDGSKGEKSSSKSDAQSKARDREERALRREQLRDQSDETTTRHGTASSSCNSQSRKIREPSNTGSKHRTRSKDSVTSEKLRHTSSKHSKTAPRISRRRLSSTNQRAQELKHIALVQRRKTGKRKIRRYNRNAAYEQELHREANRRAVVRAKRQASSKARERLQQQQRDFSQDGDNDDNLLDETWKLPETKGASGLIKKSQTVAKHGGNKSSTKSFSTPHAGKSSSSTSGAQQRKEDYESDVENVPDDLAAEMVSDDNGTSNSRRRKSRPAKCRGRREDNDQDVLDGQDMSGPEDETYYEEDPRNALSNIPIENVPVPADVKRLTINKNSGETLLHRAARTGHEEITLYCLKTQTVLVNARDNAGYTPLHESCVRGSVAVARHLIYHGADVNCCSQDGIRPIHDAIENDHVEVVRLLLVHGADPLIATYAGRTPLRIARSLPMLQTLQGYIADLNGWPQDEEEEEDEQEEEEVLPWRFTSSLTFLETSQADKYSPCVDLPDDPTDDSNDVFDDGPTSAINVFNLALDGEDRTPQPFCLLDEVIHRLNMSEDKITSLFPWKPSSVTLSSERVREVASCCCSNVSIRLPQSGKVTLLPFSTLNNIEKALKQQMKMKVKKEEGETAGKEMSKRVNNSSCVPILTRLEHPNSFLEDGLHSSSKESALKSSLLQSTSSSFKQKPKSSMMSSTFSSTSSSLVLTTNIPGTHKMSKPQTSVSQNPASSVSEQPSSKKVLTGHHHRHHHHQPDQHLHHSQQHQHPFQQRSSSSAILEPALPAKATSSNKEGRSFSTSGINPLRKPKKEDYENPWMNTPMFSDESSSSPFHTSLDCLDSDNSI